ncbi:MAG: right-handed parallel beta-helix repeat-containing protein [Lachnospiraceae bacterium]|nr:right-handed parallel beta-helix repeat-containing protein [Lachnospiraceae bacterium]
MKRKTKQILAWLLAVLMVFGLVPAISPKEATQVKAANVEDGGWTVWWTMDDTTTSVKDGARYGNYTAVAPKENSTKITANSKSLNGIDFTHRFQFGTTGSAESVNISFEAPTAGVLTVYGITANSSATDRCLELSGPNGYKQTTAPLPNQITECKFEFEEGGTYQLYSVVGGINIYYLSYEMTLEGKAPEIAAGSVSAEVPTLSQGSTEATADISWEIAKAAEGAARILVEYKLDDAEWQMAGIVDADETSFAHDILQLKSGELSYRVSGLGTPNSNPVESSASAWEQPRRPWSEVSAPVVSGVQGTGDDAGEITVKWNMAMGCNGADKITVKLMKGEKIVEDVVYTAAGVDNASSGEVVFEPTASCDYRLVVTAVRNGEDKKINGESAINFIAPLETPAIESVRCTGTGTAEITWIKVREANEYEVFAKSVGADDSTYVSFGKTEENTMTLSGLTDGEKYTFKVVAYREAVGDQTEATQDKQMTGKAERAFVIAPVGSNAKGTVSGDFYSSEEPVVITSTGGKIADSEDGFMFYYTEVGADENFVMEATFEVTGVNVGGTMSNQTGFGIMAIDTIAGANESNGRYFNSAGVTFAKFRKVNPDTGSSSSFDNIAGLRVVNGYTNPKANEGEKTRLLNNTDTGFEYPVSNDATKSYEIGDKYHFVLRRSNTGYHGTLVKENGTEIERIFYYPEGDDYTDPLLVQDMRHIYVGLMASRYIEVTVTDMSLEVINAADDEARIDPPVVYTIPKVDLFSTTTTGSAEYPFEYRANIGGQLVVKDAAGNELINKQIAAEEYVEETFTLKEGGNVFTCRLTPDEDEILETYDPITSSLAVTYKTYGNANETIIVTPEGTGNGNGSEASPLDIYTAFKYVQPGQTILLKNGTYKLTEAIKVKRGHDGTENGRITVVAETPGEVIIDLEGSTGGINISADYWHLYGLDVRNSEFGVKPVHIQGNYNIVELCSVHDNGDSGIQISGSSNEPYDKWPDYNLIKNCDAYDNADYKGNDADGFAAKLTSGDGNVFEGCISHHNIDDGWDLYAKSTTGSIGPVVIRNCVAYANGSLSENARLRGKLLAEDQGEGNGFKLGGESMPGKHELINCITFANGAKGVTSNSGPDCIVRNVTTYGNGTFGKAESISLYTSTADKTEYVAEGVLSMEPVSGAVDKFDLKGQEPLTSDNNYFWNGSESANASGAKADESWFESVDVAIAPTRNADGSVNMNGLLQLTDAAAADTGARLEPVVSERPNVPAAITGDSMGDAEDEGKTDTEKTASPAMTIVLVIVVLIAAAGVAVVAIPGLRSKMTDLIKKNK